MRRADRRLQAGARLPQRGRLRRQGRAVRPLRPDRHVHRRRRGGERNRPQRAGDQRRQAAPRGRVEDAVARLQPGDPARQKQGAGDRALEARPQPDVRRVDGQAGPIRRARQAGRVQADARHERAVGQAQPAQAEGAAVPAWAAGQDGERALDQQAVEDQFAGAADWLVRVDRHAGRQPRLRGRGDRAHGEIAAQVRAEAGGQQAARDPPPARRGGVGRGGPIGRDDRQRAAGGDRDRPVAGEVDRVGGTVHHGDDSAPVDPPDAVGLLAVRQPHALHAVRRQRVPGSDRRGQRPDDLRIVGGRLARDPDLEVVAPPHVAVAVEPVRDRSPPIVRAAAEVAAEAVGVADRRGRGRARRDGEPPEDRVHQHLVRGGRPPPRPEVADADLRGRDRRDPAVPPAPEDLQHRPVVEVAVRAGRLLAAPQRLQLVVEGATAQRAGDVRLAGPLGDVALGAGAVEERRVDPERVEGEAPVGGVGDRAGRAAPDRVGLEPPEEEADVGDGVAAAAVGDVAEFGGVRRALERPVDQFEAVGVAQIREGAAGEPRVVEVLGRRQPLEELDGARGPAGHVARQLLQHRGGPLAPPVAEGVGNDRALAQRPQPVRDRQQPADIEEVAEVGDDPLVAGLDEPVVVEPGDVVLDQPQLVLDHGQQRPQRLPLCRVALAVDRGEQVVEAFGGRRAHGVS